MWLLNFAGCEEGRETSFTENTKPPTDNLNGEGIENATDVENIGTVIFSFKVAESYKLSSTIIG